MHQSWTPSFDGCGFLVADGSGRVLYANELLCRMSREPRTELVGRQLEAVIAARRWDDVVVSPILGAGGEHLGSYAHLRAGN